MTRPSSHVAEAGMEQTTNTNKPQEESTKYYVAVSEYILLVRQLDMNISFSVNLLLHNFTQISGLSLRHALKKMQLSLLCFKCLQWVGGWLGQLLKATSAARLDDLQRKVRVSSW